MEYTGTEPELEAGEGNGGIGMLKTVRDFIVLTIKKYGINHKKDFVINNPDASVGAQCSMFRTVCSIRWLQSALIPFVTTQASGD